MASEPPRPVEDLFTDSPVPSDRPRVFLDARDLPPPEPLQTTLERLAELDDETVLVQYNDRVPQHLFPRLEDRGYRSETADADGVVVTAIWTGDA